MSSLRDDVWKALEAEARRIRVKTDRGVTLNPPEQAFINRASKFLLDFAKEEREARASAKSIPLHELLAELQKVLPAEVVKPLADYLAQQALPGVKKKND